MTFEGRAVWTLYFGETADAYSPEDLVRATVWTVTGLLALYRAFADVRAAITPLLDDLVALVDHYWEPDYQRIADVEFRVPLGSRRQELA